MIRFAALLCLVNVCFAALSPQIIDQLKELQSLQFENAQSSESARLGEAIINATIVRISESLGEHDPYYIEEQEIIIARDNINVEATLSNVNAEGFSGFVATALSFSLARQTLTFTLEIPKVSVSSGYVADGLLFFIPLYGNGQLDVEVGSIVASGTARVSLSSLSVSELSLSYSIGNIDVSLTGLLGNEDLSLLISELLTDVAADLLNDISDVVSEFLSEILQDLINNAISSS